MGERVIAILQDGNDMALRDPSAPSVEEIVRVMRQAQVEVFPTSGTASKLGVLIARLEGENAKS